MAVTHRPLPKQRPVYLNLVAIRLPLPGLISILHRISGALLFLIGIPVLLWAVQSSLVSQDTYARFQSVFATPIAKLIALALVWAYVHHLLAGLRHLVLDLDVGTELQSARQSAAAVLVLAIIITIIVAVRLW
jgi:succinate dehydrogenase / fumarate reductase cytochrome b subunit